MKTIVKILMAPLILLIGNAYAQNRKFPSNFADVTIRGRVTDSLIINRPGGKTTVTVQISEYPFSHPGIQGVKNLIYNVDVKYNEPFYLKISAPAKRFYMYVYYAQDYQGTAAIDDMSWSSIDNIYILEQGDHIEANLGRDYFKFSGKGSDKLNCESEIYKNSFNGRMINRHISEELSSLMNQGNYKKRNALLDHGKDSCLVIQKAIIEKYKKRIGNQLGSIMLANCYGIRYFWELRGARQMSDGEPAFYRTVVTSPAYKKIDLALSRKIPPDLLVQAPIYVDFLFEKIRMDNYLEADGTHQIGLYYKKTFNAVKNNYYGIIRDKLLALFFINNSKFPTSMGYLNDAINLCGSSIYKDFLVDLKETKSKGNPFYQFALPDTDGNIVKLSDLDKKVVILDFWYTGCENCINLHRSMEAIHNKYKNNPQVVFVSVSIDRDKQQWIKSVESAMYTDPNDINLFTYGQAAKHPLLEKYDIASFPTAFILKNGKIFSSNPPRPDSISLSQGSTKEYVDLIEEALAKKSM